jgi:hypothetical protein
MGENHDVYHRADHDRLRPCPSQSALPRFQVFGVYGGDDDRFTFYELKSARISGFPEWGAGPNSPDLANLGSLEIPKVESWRGGLSGPHILTVCSDRRWSRSRRLHPKEKGLYA